MLEGKYVRLRQIEEVDLPKLRDWANSPYIRAYTREEVKAIIEKLESF